MDVDLELEQLMGHLGEFGKYQRTQFLLHILAAFTAGIHMLTLVTVAGVPEHRCALPGESQNDSYSWNSSIVLARIPLRADGTLESCYMLDDSEDSSNSTIPCDSWIYDRTYYPSSRAVEWNFVCDRRWMSAVSQSSYMLGVLTGAVSLGTVADKYGRKKVLYSSVLMQLFLGVLVAFIPYFYPFLLIRYLYGIFGSAGAYNTAFVLSMELVGPSKRTACGLTFQGMFALGIMVVAFWGWLIPDRFYLQIIYGLHSALLLGHWWWVDESPRWLWANGQKEEAKKIIHKALRINGTPSLAYDDSSTKHLVKEVQKEQKGPSVGLTSLFKTPNLRRRALNVCFNWFANSLAYYGLSLNAGTLPGNPFLMLFALAAVEIPSYVATAYLLDKTGRRSLISSMMIFGGIACVISAFIPQSSVALKTTVIVIVMIGKILIAGSFAIIYNYTAELFPTVVRNTAIGIGAMCARLSGALCPLLILLDSLDKTLPIVIFAITAVASGILSLFLPETMDKPMPQSIEDGERFGTGDTAFNSCCKPRIDSSEVPLKNYNRR